MTGISTAALSRKLHPNSYCGLIVSCGHHVNMDWRLGLYLKARDSEPAGLVRQSGDWNDERAVGDVLVVELDRHLVVAWEADGVFTDFTVFHR